MNPFRRNPTNNAIGVLQGRSQLYKNGPHYETATRNPAYIKVIGTAKSCRGAGDETQYPLELNTFEEFTKYESKLKSPPSLKEVTIEYGGDYGLAQSITLTIECYNKKDFENVEKTFLLPGNEIKAKFGYGKSRHKQDQPVINIGPFKVSQFSFTTTQQGHWIATCTAVAAAEAVNDVEVLTSINTSLKYRGGFSKKYPVKGIAELIAYDSQKNGEKKIDELEDGETIKPSGGGGIVVYNSEHLFNTQFGSWLNKMWNRFDSKTEAEQTHNTVYITLEYIVKRLLMGEVKKEIDRRIISKDSKFKDVKVVLDDEISFSWIDENIVSGSPTTCLIMGFGRGNYLNSDDQGKAFEDDCQNLSAVKAVDQISEGRQKILHKHILLERSIVANAIEKASKKREAQADNVSVKDTKEHVLSINDFLKDIFDHIGKCTGGAIQLRTSVHPNNLDQMVILDQNNGKKDGQLKVVVFNPMDGDGSTRNCTLQSNVGSEEFKAYMFAGVSKKGDPVANIRGCKEQVDSKRKSPYNDAKKSKKEIINSPGSLGSNEFGAIQENALMSVMGSLAKGAPKSEKFELMPYMGMSIDLEIDGVYGFSPGTGVSTTQLPNHYFSKKNYFMIRKVTHTFSADNASDWSTRLSGVMTMYSDIQYIRL